MNKCPACNSEKHKIDMIGVRDYLFGVKGEWNLVKCNTCKSRFINPWPEDFEISRFYDKYFTHDAPSSGSVGMGKKIKKAINNFFLFISRYGIIGELIIKFISARFSRKYCYLSGKTKLNICDYGCGNGDLISNLRSIGHQVTGYDFDPLAIAAARTRGLRVKSIDCFKDDDNLYDRILLMNVIEHLAWPTNVLNLLSSRLKSDGLLYIETPNPNSTLALLLRKRWRGLEAPRHLVLYSKRGLNELMNRSGFVLCDEYRVNANKFIILNSNISSIAKYGLLMIAPLLTLIEILFKESRDSRLYVFRRG